MVHCRYCTTTKPAKALRLLCQAEAKNDAFDLVIIDYEMPDMSGVELGAAIAKDPSISATSIIMTTSYAMIDNDDDIKSIGIKAVLKKPISQTALYRYLISAISEETTTVIKENKEIVHYDMPSMKDRCKPHILIVEDNLINQKVAMKMIEVFGHSAKCANNGKEALECLQKSRFDLILMDIQMPEMDGFEATRRIRDTAFGINCADIPIIAMTAHAMKGDSEKCIEAGMNHCLAKPIDPDVLKNVLYTGLWHCSSRHGKPRLTCTSPWSSVQGTRNMMTRSGSTMRWMILALRYSGLRSKTGATDCSTSLTAW